MQHKSGNAIVMPFSLEDLIKFVKGGGVVASGNEAKQKKGSRSSAPRSYLFQTRCSVCYLNVCPFLN